MIIFISGGSKSGKSKIAELWASKLNSKGGRLVYLATMKPYDNEDLKRIAPIIVDKCIILIKRRCITTYLPAFCITLSLSNL
ncbi:MAG: bifunctional adenosylcobinamide kinase/adenosylcobinamide-phosphate guanylyltransferase, partial [Clostridium baratii]|uniref:bifunctional adenosylcobinamide kinase/adenosylcobinamide-phosphate guanylyltransferase n=1 Tax=Clostridium baratii TaxID=1561 RepID=UPI002430471A